MQLSRPDELLTRGEAAEHLRVCVKTLERLLSTGNGPPVVHLTPRRILFRRNDLAEWINSRVTEGGGAR